MKRKKGDTLIEVALAIGIFSLVAVVVVSVISATTTSAQNALELTLTREDLDAQAEALRFIHDSYVNDSQSKKINENAYAEIWKEITRLAIDEPSIGTGDAENILNFNPQTCSDIYDVDNGSVNKLKSATKSATPFIINIRQLSSTNPEEIVIFSRTSSPGVFYEAQTYPRIIYRGAEAENLYTQTDLGDKNEIARVEGIYIIAVKDSGSKIVTGGNSGKDSIEIKSIPSYYDFYIRSCWMPPNATHASTISTVVRLYDPAVIDYKNS